MYLLWYCWLLARKWGYFIKIFSKWWHCFPVFFFEKFFNKHIQENLGWHRESWEECVHKKKTFVAFWDTGFIFLEGILFFATWRRCGSIFPIVKRAQSGRHYPQLTFEWLLLSAVSPLLSPPWHLWDRQEFWREMVTLTRGRFGELLKRSQQRGTPKCQTAVSEV